MVVREALIVYPPIVSTNQYQPKHYHDHKLKDKEMDLARFIEFLKNLSPLGVQWMVGWWRIEAMSSYDFKEKCISLVRLPHCLYYPMCPLQGNSATIKGFPVAMVPPILWHLLRGS